jgi:hypothetical protein
MKNAALAVLVRGIPSNDASLSMVVASGVSDANGNFSIPNIGPGTYTFREQRPPGEITSPGGVFLTAAHEMRSKQRKDPQLPPQRFVEHLKPRTNDMRDAPAIKIIQALVSEGATIAAYDPEAMDEAKRIFGDRILRARVWRWSKPGSRCSDERRSRNPAIPAGAEGRCECASSRWRHGAPATRHSESCLT